MAKHGNFVCAEQMKLTNLNHLNKMNQNRLGMLSQNEHQYFSVTMTT